MPWSATFVDPIVLPDGRKLLTLRDAADWQVAMETLYWSPSVTGRK
ncbi:hypothetical protein ACFIOY_35525 [Bradyrhizobium sp. TZ2]